MMEYKAPNTLALAADSDLFFHISDFLTETALLGDPSPPTSTQPPLLQDCCSIDACAKPKVMYVAVPPKRPDPRPLHVARLGPPRTFLHLQSYTHPKTVCSLTHVQVAKSCISLARINGIISTDCGFSGRYRMRSCCGVFRMSGWLWGLRLLGKWAFDLVGPERGYLSVGIIEM
jgi:hypothetical protein